MSPVPSILVLGVTGEKPFLNIDQVPTTNAPIVINTVFLTTTWLLVGLRAWTRGRILKAFGWDDLAMLFALLFFTVFSIGFLMTHLYTNGRKSLTKSALTQSTVWLLVAEDFYILTMISLKISLSLFFLRVLLQPWERRIIYVVVTLSTLFGTAYFFVAVFQCGVYKNAFDFWTKLISNQCITPPQVLGISYTYAVITTLTDCTFALLPIPMLRDSQLALKEKFIVGFILILGAMGSIASMVRLKFVPKLANLTLSFYSDAETLAEWSSIELALGITAACLATLRPLLRRLVETTRSINSKLNLSRSSRNKRNPSLGSNENQIGQNAVPVDQAKLQRKEEVSFTSTTSSLPE